MSDNYSSGFDCGVKIACHMYGISEDDCLAASHRHAIADNSKDMQDAICKIASSIFHAAGDADSAALYDGLLASGHLMKNATARSILLDSVLQAIAEQAASEEMSKSAFLTKLIGGGVGMMPDLLKGGAGLALLVGGGLGAGWWALNRDANASSAKTAVKEEQAKYYRELAKKIRDKAGKTKKRKLNKKEVAKIVEDAAPMVVQEEEKPNLGEAVDTIKNLSSTIYG